MRKTARLANQLNAEWYVVYVRTDKEAPDKILAETHRRLTDTLEIAQKMGGTVLILKSNDIVTALTSFTHDYGITQVVMGKIQAPQGLEKILSLPGRPSEREPSASGHYFILSRLATRTPCSEKVQGTDSASRPARRSLFEDPA